MTIFNQLPFVHVPSLMTINSSLSKGEQVFYLVDDDEIMNAEEVGHKYREFPTPTELESLYAEKKTSFDFVDAGKDMTVSLALRIVGPSDYMAALWKSFISLFGTVSNFEKTGKLPMEMKSGLPDQPSSNLSAIEKHKDEKTYNNVFNLVARSDEIKERMENLNMALAVFGTWAAKKKEDIAVTFADARDGQKQFNVANGNTLSSKNSTYFTGSFQGVTLALQRAKAESETLAHKVIDGFKLLLTDKIGEGERRPSRRASETKRSDVKVATKARVDKPITERVSTALKRNTKDVKPRDDKSSKIRTSIKELDDEYSDDDVVAGTGFESDRSVEQSDDSDEEDY